MKMNFTQTYFQKDLDDITSEDLIKFFSIPQKETQYLEFKSSRELNLNKVFSNTLKPSICAFLNSEGGLLIYGAPKEDRTNSDHPYNGEMDIYNKGFLGDHDTIIRKISGGIIPLPNGIRFREVEFPQGCVAIIEIQQSQNKPHQTNNTYYIRIDGQKVPAPHFLIEAMMKQIKFPIIKSYIKVNESYYHDVFKNVLLINFSLFFFNFSQFQNEKNLRYRLQIDGPMFLELGDVVGKNSKSKTDYFMLERISYGEPISYNFTLSGKLGSITKDYEIFLNIIFNGETRPSKLTVYKFKILETSQRGFLESHNAKLEINNVLFSEHQKNIGLSHEESIMKSFGIDIELFDPVSTTAK